MAVENLLVEIGLRDKGLTAGLKSSATESRKLTSSLEGVSREAKNVESSVSRFARAAGGAFASGQIVRGLTASADAFGALVNATETADAVFGDASDSVIEFADNAVDAVGLSKRAAIEAQSALGGLGKAAGLVGDDLVDFSQDMTRVAADLAAAFGGDVQKAVDAIRSGLSGTSTEPLRAYNIILNDTALKNEVFAQTGERVTGVLTQQQRTLATVALLQQQSADYTGQWARESDGLIGSQQRLNSQFENASASLGEQLAPALANVFDLTSGALGAFTGLNEALGGLPATAAVAAAGMVSLGLATRSASNGLQGAFNFGEVGAGRLAKATKLANVATLGLGAAFVISNEYRKQSIRDEERRIALLEKSAELAAVAGESEQSLADARRAFQTATGATFGSGADQDERVRAFTRNVEEYAAASREQFSAFVALSKAQESNIVLTGRQNNVAVRYTLTTAEQARIIDETAAKFAEQEGAQSSYVDALAEGDKIIAAYGETNEATGASVGRLADKLGVAEDASAKFSGEADGLVSEIGDIGEAADDARERVDDFFDAIRADFGNDFDGQRARLDIAEFGLTSDEIDAQAKALATATDEYAKQLDLQKQGSSELRDGFDAEAEGLELRRQSVDVERARLDLAERRQASVQAILDADIAALNDDRRGDGLGELTGADLFAEQLRILGDLRAEFPGLNAEIDRFVELLGQAPTELTLDLDTQTADAAIAAVRAQVDAPFVVSVLTKAGFSEPAAADLVQLIGEQNATTVVVDALTDAAEQDVSQLEDADRVAEIAVTAVSQQFDERVAEIEQNPYSASVELAAVVDNAQRTLDNFVSANDGRQVRVGIVTSQSGTVIPRTERSTGNDFEATVPRTAQLIDNRSTTVNVSLPAGSDVDQLDTYFRRNGLASITDR